MKQDLTFIGIVADSSGSMSGIINETVGSINRLVREQQDVQGEAIYSLLVFDYKSKWINNFVDLKTVEPITTKDYWLGGGTALYDAVAIMIIQTGSKLAAMKEEDRPSKVVIAIITDGEENASSEFAISQGGLEKLKALIETQTTKYNWQFMFLGADINAQQTASSIGIITSNAMSYNATSKGMHDVYSASSNVLRNYRSSNVVDAVLEISDEDREANAPDKA